MAAPRKGASPRREGGNVKPDRRLDAETVAELEAAVRRQRITQENLLLGQRLDLDERLERAGAYVEAVHELGELVASIEARPSG